MFSHWPSSPLIAHNVLLLVIMHSHWSSNLLIGYHVISLVIKSSHWSSSPLIGHQVLSLVILSVISSSYNWDRQTDRQTCAFLQMLSHLNTTTTTFHLTVFTNCQTLDEHNWPPLELQQTARPLWWRWWGRALGWTLSSKGGFWISQCLLNHWSSWTWAIHPHSDTSARKKLKEMRIEEGNQLKHNYDSAGGCDETFHWWAKVGM